VNRTRRAAGRQLAVLEGDGARQGGADGPVGVADLVGQVDVVAVPDGSERVREELVAQVGPGVLELHPLDEVPRTGAGGGRQQRREVHGVGALVASGPLPQQVDPAHGLVDGAQPERGQVAPHLLGDEHEVGGDALGGAGEVRAQVGPLGGDPGLARVPVAGPEHDAALRDHGRGAEAVFVRTQEGGDDHLAPGEEATVDADPHPAPQAVVDQRPLRVGQA